MENTDTRFGRILSSERDHKMKRLSLIIICFFLLCACSTRANVTTVDKDITPYPTKATAAPTEKPKMTQKEALEILKNYINSNQYSMVSKLANDAGISSGKSMSIGSIENGNGMFASGIKFTINGKFFGYDKYGDLKGVYVFSWAATVDDSGSVTLAVNPSVTKR